LDKSDSEYVLWIRRSRVRSNDKIPTPNVTVLEWLHKKTSYQGKSVAFVAWDVFPWLMEPSFPTSKVGAGSVGFFVAVIFIAQWKKYCRAIQYDPDS
jgi:hypothetical protein